MTTKETTGINFHFDPLCPLAWRAALWIREVRKVRPLNVTWRFFSLEVVNRKEASHLIFRRMVAGLRSAHWRFHVVKVATMQRNGCIWLWGQRNMGAGRALNK